ncbi:hypothetical protein [Paraburkholderia tropica]|uniref:hypothetical protein n=1 Tax=Paraburkholderia tropica TaxID=92647 RepID=UPI002AB2EFB6|nr:hypothetical protein [Paraburkholderia tropica]
MPAKYLFDAENIASRFGYVNRFVLGQSYDNTALFYDFLLLSRHRHLAAFVFSFIFVYFVSRCLVVSGRINLDSLHDLLIFSFACVVGAVYLGQYSKESTSLLLVIAFMVLSNTRSGRLLWVVMACIYAAYFRPYWAIVVALYLFFRFILNRGRTPAVFFLSIVFALFALALMFNVVLGIDLAYYRYVVNDTRTYDVAANTMIKPILPVGGIILEWCNAVLQFILMFFPLPLISANPLYLVFFVMIASLGIRLWSMLKNLANIPRELRATKSKECLGLLMAFVTVQSIFEPDYGSYIRHLMPMLPVALFITCRNSIFYGYLKEGRAGNG